MGMLVNIGEAAKVLGVHPETLRRLGERGKIPAPRKTPGGTRRNGVDPLGQGTPKREAVSPYDGCAGPRVEA